VPIRDLATHSAQYVTVGELADYWAVSRQQIYKSIECGALSAIRLGARLYRVRTAAALVYERTARMSAAHPLNEPQEGRRAGGASLRRVQSREQ
jgi:excisionase family DNA binding protein